MKKGEYSVQSSNFLSVDDVINYYKKLTSATRSNLLKIHFLRKIGNHGKKLLLQLGIMSKLLGMIYCNNSKRLEKGEKSANSILVKPNQIGTLLKP